MPDAIESRELREATTAVTPNEKGAEPGASFEQAVATASAAPLRSSGPEPTHSPFPFPFTDLPAEMRNQVKSFMPPDDRRALAFTSSQQLGEAVQTNDHRRTPLTPMRLFSGDALANRLLSSRD